MEQQAQAWRLKGCPLPVPIPAGSLGLEAAWLCPGEVPTERCRRACFLGWIGCKLCVSARRFVSTRTEVPVWLQDMVLPAPSPVLCGRVRSHPAGDGDGAVLAQQAGLEECGYNGRSLAAGQIPCAFQAWAGQQIAC